MVPFGGWEMPVQYPSGILAEARAVRNAAGLFDVSHMGRIELHGDGALRAMEGLTPNRVERLTPGFGQYSLFLNERGGVVDDLIVYCQEPNLYALIVNASNTPKVLAWLKERLPSTVSMMDRTPATALLALQGPLALSLMEEAGVKDAALIGRFQRRAALMLGQPAWVMRTGYTGEDGFEIQCSASEANSIWNGLLRLGGPERITPCGLGARDVLRIEAAYPLYGHEIDEECNPWEAGLGWVLKKDDGFVGAESLARLRAERSRRLVGLTMESRSVARQGDLVLQNGEPCGVVSSGTFSPTLNASIALAFVEIAALDRPDAAWEAQGTRRTLAARLTPLPFVPLPVARKKKAA